MAASGRLCLRNCIDNTSCLTVIALSLRRQSELAGRAVKQPRPQMPLERGNVPADIRLSSSHLPGNGGEAPGLYYPGKAMYEQEFIHRKVASTRYSFNLRINVIPIRRTYLIQRGGG